MGLLLLPFIVAECFLCVTDESIDSVGGGDVVKVTAGIDPLDGSRGREANSRSPRGGRGVERVSG